MIDNLRILPYSDISIYDYTELGGKDMEKIAIVTGAGNGIGAATAKKFASEGIKVAVVDIAEAQAQKVADEIKKAGGEAIAVRCDVSKKADVESCIEQVEKEFGVPTILINNAGIGGPFHRVDEVTEEEFDLVFGVNIKSVYLFTHNLLPKMKELGFGRIVNTASIQGMYGSPGSSSYVATKHAVIGYTRTIAAEWGKYGITCNAVCPGYVQTAMGAQDDAVDDYTKKVMSMTPTHTIAKPEELAEMMFFLIEQAYMNGSVNVMDGGITCHVGIMDV